MGAAMTALLEVDGVVKTFAAPHRRRLRAVDEVSFSLERGRTLALVGESGCGKTTTSRIVARLLEPDEGGVSIDGVDLTHARGGSLRRLRRRFQIVFQDPSSSLDPRWTVARIVEEPLRAHRQPRSRVDVLLDQVGLDPATRHRYPNELSSGQRQRVALARALALDPELLVLDEPVSALDVSVRAQILNLLVNLQRERQLSYLYVTHDLATVQYLADEVAVMYLGRIVEHGTTAEVSTHPRHPYTRALLDAIPVPDPSAARSAERATLVGELPSAIDPPSGCRFRTRCPKAQDLCAHEEPALTDSEGHAVACHFPN